MHFFRASFYTFSKTLVIACTDIYSINRCYLMINSITYFLIIFFISSKASIASIGLSQIDKQDIPRIVTKLFIGKSWRGISFNSLSTIQLYPASFLTTFIHGSERGNWRGPRPPETCMVPTKHPFLRTQTSHVSLYQSTIWLIYHC